MKPQLYHMLSIGLLFVLCFSCQGNKGTSFYKNKVIAHRGAWKASENPQNSIASLREAVRLGCEGSEFDVRMTEDGVLVLNHDADFQGIDIETSTYEKLLQIKLPNGEKIPTVAEYLEEGLNQSSTKLIFEIKPSLVSKARGLEIANQSVRKVKEMGAEEWVDYISFDYEICLKVMELDPNARVAYLNGDKTPEELKEAGFYGLDYNLNVVKKNPDWIQQARELDLTVNVWTVNQAEDMEWLLENDIEFITTDEPELLFKLINK